MQAERESLRGAIENRRETGVRHLSRVREACRQVSEDRERQILQWRVLKEAWKEPFRPEQEPLWDEAKAHERFSRLLGALLMAVTEVAFATWFTRTYLEIPALPAARPLRALVLAAPGVLLAAAIGLLFHEQMASHDNKRRPKKAYRRLAGITALTSAIGLVAIGAFLLTRHLLSGAQILIAGLGVPTLALAASVAASLHCAEVLHRPNRMAARYHASSRLLARLEGLERLLERIASRAKRDGDARLEGGITQGSPEAVERCGEREDGHPVLGAIRPNGGLKEQSSGTTMTTRK